MRIKNRSHITPSAAVSPAGGYNGIKSISRNNAPENSVPFFQ